MARNKNTRKVFKDYDKQNNKVAENLLAAIDEAIWKSVEHASMRAINATPHREGTVMMEFDSAEGAPLSQNAAWNNWVLQYSEPSYFSDSQVDDEIKRAKKGSPSDDKSVNSIISKTRSGKSLPKKLYLKNKMPYIGDLEYGSSLFGSKMSEKAITTFEEYLRYYIKDYNRR